MTILYMILSTFVMITFIATFLTLIDWLDEEAERKTIMPLLEICKGKRCAGYHPQSVSEMYVRIAAAETITDDRELWIESARESKS